MLTLPLATTADGNTVVAPFPPFFTLPVAVTVSPPPPPIIDNIIDPSAGSSEVGALDTTLATILAPLPVGSEYTISEALIAGPPGVRVWEAITAIGVGGG